MDKESKIFFEKLSGINKNSQTDEEEIESSLADEEGSSDDFEDTEGQLTVDVYETPVVFVIKSTVAGVEPDNLDIVITNESVTIKGKREQEEKIKTENYLHRECYWGKFSRSIILPQEIDPDRAQAALKNGVLKITLPKINKTKAKKLKIKFE